MVHINVNNYNKNHPGYIELEAQKVAPESGEEGIIFLNELDNEPKYREPNNGKVFDLILRRYFGKKCEYESNNDTNGLLYWIGTDFGAKDWARPYDQYIQLNPSSFVEDSSYFYREALSQRRPDTFSTDDQPYSFINVDLHTEQMLQVSGIYLKSPSVAKFGFIKSYHINIIDTLRSEIGYQQIIDNDDRLVGTNTELYLPLPNVSFKTKHVQIIQTGLNSAGTNHLALGQIELYGVFT